MMSPHRYSFVQNKPISPRGESHAIAMALTITHVDTFRFAFEIHIVATSRDLACSNTSSLVLYAAMDRGFEKGVAHGVNAITDGDSHRVTSFIHVVGTVRYLAFRNAAHLHDTTLLFLG